MYRYSRWSIRKKHQVMYGNAAGDMEMYSTLGETKKRFYDRCNKESYSKAL